VTELTPYPRAAAEREAVRSAPVPTTGYASWGRRAGALIVDNLLLLVPVAVFFALVFVPNDVVAGVSIFLALAFWFLFPFVYFTVLHGRLGGGQTLGKRLLKIRVKHAEGHTLGYGPAFGRYAMTFVFGIFTVPLILDYLFPLWDSRKQSLHDKVVGSVVVRA
jgi:uncharacterized RDD family membrane protein YckC